MKVLIACEFSGVVRDAFRAKGHDAWSCDFEKCLRDSQYHIKTNVECLRPLGERAWDLMIAHPPCTYLCNSGVRHLYKNGKKENGVDLDRWRKMINAAKFFIRLNSWPVKRIAIENPIPHFHARDWIGDYTQLIQPWQFGHGETKATCLWLKNLPKLKPTNIVEGRENRIHKMPPSKDRGKLRSIFYTGIAEAMAEQWGDL